MKQSLLIFSLYFLIVLNLTAQTNTFPTSGNVGIGTTTPAVKLHVNSLTVNSELVRLDNNGLRSTSFINYSDGVYDNAGLQIKKESLVGQFKFSNLNGDLMTILPSGNVGIGTTIPTAKLEVSSGISGDAILKIESDIDNNNESDNPRIELRQDGGLHGADIGFNSDWGGPSSDNLFRIVTRASAIDDYNSFVINPMNRRVGIGTSTPDEKLSVNGNIHTKEVRVDLEGWSDFVFENNYKLPTLKEVEQHIKEKGHLKDIPSAEDVKENGIFLGEMDSKLLQKIEELTLYTIEQQKEIENLKRENTKLQSLSKRLEDIEKLLGDKK